MRNLLLAFACLWSVTAQAEEKPRLKVVVDLAEAAEGCGFDKSSIASHTARILHKNGILDTTENNTEDPFSKENTAQAAYPPFFFFYVQVNAVPTAAVGCAFSIHVEVREYSVSIKYPLTVLKTRRNPFITLCDDGSIALAPLATAKTELKRGLEGDIKNCLKQLDY